MPWSASECAVCAQRVPVLGCVCANVRVNGCVCVCMWRGACFSLPMGREGFWQNLRKSHGICFEIMDYKKERGGKELV